MNMIKLKINGTNYEINPVSSLSFKDFNKIIVKGNVTDLKEYIAVTTDIPIDDLMSAKVEGVNFPALHQMIFDVDIEKTIKDPKKTLSFRGQTVLTDSLEMETFGKVYYYDLYLQKFGDKKINHYELMLYALAIALTEKLDSSIEGIYDELAEKNWRQVLPQGFFLNKRLAKKNRRLTRLLASFTHQLRSQNLRTLDCRRKLIAMERN